MIDELRERYDIAVVTNDIYTREDAEFLVRHGALEPERMLGVETGGCPHTAIREDASMNLAAVEDLQQRFPDLDLVFIESGGDNLSATFSPELADVTLYVIDVAAGEEIAAPAADENVVPGPADQPVGAAAAVERIPPAAADQPVPAGAA